MKPIDKTERYTLSKMVVESIKQYILNNGLSPGDRLPSERDLCQMMNISRTILREALHALESIGILEIRHGEGSYVSDHFFQPMTENLRFALQMNKDDAADMLEIRYMLEAAAIDQWNGDSSNPHFLEAIQLSSKGEDERFHLRIIGALQNEAYVKMCEPFIANFPSGHDAAKTYEQITAEHEAYIAALQSGDRELAKRRLKQHLGMAD